MEKYIDFLFICMVNLMAVFHFWSPAIWSGKSSMWERLPNSGDLLELLIPNYIRKAISGWTNHSCKVTSQKAYENNVEYRGSKSDLIFNLKNKFKLKSVKEQRVDGSQYINLTHLRCTLLGFERNSQIKIPSNQINNSRLYSTIEAQQGEKQICNIEPVGDYFIYINRTNIFNV